MDVVINSQAGCLIGTLHFTVMAPSEMRFEMLTPSQFSSAPEIVHNENNLRLKKERKR